MKNIIQSCFFRTFINISAYFSLTIFDWITIYLTDELKGCMIVQPFTVVGWYDCTDVRLYNCADVQTCKLIGHFQVWPKWFKIAEKKCKNMLIFLARILQQFAPTDMIPKSGLLQPTGWEIQWFFHDLFKQN